MIRDFCVFGRKGYWFSNSAFGCQSGKWYFSIL